MKKKKQGWVLITGATSGIGFEFVKLFAKKGYNLILVARNRQRMHGLKKKLESFFDIKVVVLITDLSV
ncbi:MAG: SDR family NAD(P)-dependent oxidoreductase, partial [Eubacterium sp.]|nr:SDR family NAD(P)-dependent oxidoreductase [Eubacterium sp.]